MHIHFKMVRIFFFFSPDTVQIQPSIYIQQQIWIQFLATLQACFWICVGCTVQLPLQFCLCHSQYILLRNRTVMIKFLWFCGTWAKKPELCCFVFNFFYYPFSSLILGNLKEKISGHSHSLAQRGWGLEKALASSFNCLDNGTGAVQWSCMLLFISAKGTLPLLKIESW